MVVTRKGKTVLFSEGENKATVQFVKSHDASNYRNAISFKNQVTFDEAVNLIREYRGKRIHK